MAIALDNTTTVTPVISGNFAHTTSGSDRALFVAVHARGTGGTVSVTYNGVSMTSGVSIDFGSGNKQAWIFYLAAPASGSNSVAYTFGGGIGESVITAISFTGVDQSTPTGGTGSASDGGNSSITASITLTGTNSWILDAFNEGGDTPFTPGTGQTQRWGAATTINGMTGYGSTKPVASSGANSTDWTVTGSTTLTLINIEIIEAAPTSAIKTIDGLAKASVKTVNGLAIASVKTWDGLA